VTKTGIRPKKYDHPGQTHWGEGTCLSLFTGDVRPVRRHTGQKSTAEGSALNPLFEEDAPYSQNCSCGKERQPRKGSVVKWERTFTNKSYREEKSSGTRNGETKKWPFPAKTTRQEKKNRIEARS